MKLELVAKAIKSLNDALDGTSGVPAAQAIRLAMAHLEDLPKTRLAMLADLLGGEVWDSGGGLEVVGIELPNGREVRITPEMVGEYYTDGDGATPCSSIPLLGDVTDYWVVQDAEGNVIFRWEGFGWASQEEADHEAAAIEAHTGVHCWARQQTLEDAESYQSRSWTREQCIKWLCDNDHNGCFTDEDCRNEGLEPLTLESARDLIAKCLRDVNGLGGV